MEVCRSCRLVVGIVEINILKVIGVVAPRTLSLLAKSLLRATKLVQSVDKTFNAYIVMCCY